MPFGVKLSLLSVTLLIATVGLSACQKPGEWQNPRVPQSEWSHDQAECLQKADEQAEILYRRYNPTGLEASPSAAHTEGRMGDFQERMSDYRLRKEENRLFRDCMRARGYTYVESGGDSR